MRPLRGLAATAVALALAISPAAVASGPSSGSSHSTTVRMMGPYDGASGTPIGRLTIQAPGIAPGYVTFTPPKQYAQNKHIKVYVQDEYGPAVAFDVVQGTRSLGAFCSKTPNALTLPSVGKPFTVYIDLGLCGSGVSAPTTGLIVVDLSR